MDRRIHNAIKLSAAVFLLNACGFAVKNNSSKEESPMVQQTELTLAQKNPSCYKQVSNKLEIASIDENGDLFTYSSPGRSPSRPDQQAVTTDGIAVVDDQCI